MSGGRPFEIGDMVAHKEDATVKGRVRGIHRMDGDWHVDIRLIAGDHILTYWASELRKVSGMCSECFFEVENGHAPGCPREEK